MKPFQVGALLAIAASCLAYGSTASAEPLTLSTDRVSIFIDDEGAVQMHSAGRDLIDTALERRPLPSNLTSHSLPRNCQQVAQRVQSQTSGRSSVGGTATSHIYTQSRTSTRICN